MRYSLYILLLMVSISYAVTPHVVTDMATGDVIEIGYGDVSRFEGNPKYAIDNISHKKIMNVKKSDFVDKTIVYDRTQQDFVDRGPSYRASVENEKKLKQIREIRIILKQLDDLAKTIPADELDSLNAEKASLTASIIELKGQ